VFRELLQNADDAGATEVQIDFQTSVYAEHSAGANGKANGINGTVPNLNTMEVSSELSSELILTSKLALSLSTVVQMGRPR
jgi:hypothetical protein